eukprot:4941531-Prymnesium_polylepis.1
MGVNTPGANTVRGVLTHYSHMLAARRALPKRFFAILRRFDANFDDFEEVSTQPVLALAQNEALHIAVLRVYPI